MILDRHKNVGIASVVGILLPVLALIHVSTFSWPVPVTPELKVPLVSSEKKEVKAEAKRVYEMQELELRQLKGSVKANLGLTDFYLRQVEKK